MCVKHVNDGYFPSICRLCYPYFLSNEGQGRLWGISSVNLTHIFSQMLKIFCLTLSVYYSNRIAAICTPLAASFLKFGKISSRFWWPFFQLVVYLKIFIRRGLDLSRLWEKLWSRGFDHLFDERWRKLVAILNNKVDWKSCHFSS